MTPPAFLALGAGSLVCALTASASILGWPRRLRRPRPMAADGRLDPRQAAALLDLIPFGASVRIEAADNAAAVAQAGAALRLLASAGRRVEDGMVVTTRGLTGEGMLHFERRGRHSLLFLDGSAGEAAWPARPPAMLSPGQRPRGMG
ncbi:hypothetical protein JMJ55_05035 [Belnapia sp. T6]|uniref:Type II secretion system protein GspC N-terminal domain-containing protein n=1 Tax=Belnapia mucosa TaxID=2804532 RepID=A0ABS1UYZ0_9PROT|nr:hypothetical protein [Belnapia mucosa]MBL6454678.1 hypothetical protein [Belnapia mucosa]